MFLFAFKSNESLIKLGISILLHLASKFKYIFEVLFNTKLTSAILASFGKKYLETSHIIPGGYNFEWQTADFQSNDILPELLRQNKLSPKTSIDDFLDIGCIEVITNHPTVFSSCCACILFFNVPRYRMTTNTTDKTSATGCAQSSPSIPIIDCKIKITGI